MGAYRSVLGSFARLLLLIFCFGLIVLAFSIGFFYGFDKCYSTTQCSVTSNFAYIILPVVVFLVEVLIWKKWGHLVGNKTRPAPKASASAIEPTDKQVLKLLETSNALTIQDLSRMSHLSEDKLIQIIGKLLRSQAISQSINDGRTVFSVKAKHDAKQSNS